METPTPTERVVQFLKAHPCASVMEITNGVALPYNDVCEAVDVALDEGKIAIKGFRSSLDLYEVAEA